MCIRDSQKDLQNPQKLEISEDGTVEMEIKSMTEPDNIPVSYTHLTVLQLRYHDICVLAYWHDVV